MALAAALGITSADISMQHITQQAPLTLRRRGVETKIILGTTTPEPDPTLFYNIKRARDWYAQIVAGTSVAELVATHHVDRNRLKRIIQLAFFAPDLRAQIMTGTQPTDFTSQWLKINQLPADWDAQCALFRAL